MTLCFSFNFAKLKVIITPIKYITENTILSYIIGVKIK